MFHFATIQTKNLLKLGTSTLLVASAVSEWGGGGPCCYCGHE